MVRLAKAFLCLQKCMNWQIFIAFFAKSCNKKHALIIPYWQVLRLVPIVQNGQNRNRNNQLSPRKTSLYLFQIPRRARPHVSSGDHKTEGKIVIGPNSSNSIPDDPEGGHISSFVSPVKAMKANFRMNQLFGIFPYSIDQDYMVFRSDIYFVVAHSFFP